MKLSAHLIAASIALAAPLAADELLIELDAKATSIAFTLGATLHTVHGSASAATGEMRLDRDTGSLVGTVVVEASSAKTGNRKRDKKMHGKVLRSAEHPRIVLHARRVEGEISLDGASAVTLHAELEILGASHQVEIPLDLEIADGRFTASAVFEVPYVEWGLTDPSTFVLRVAKFVEVSVEAHGTVGEP